MKNKELKKHINSMVDEIEVKPLDPSFLNNVTYEKEIISKKTFDFNIFKRAIITCSCLLIAILGVILIDKGIDDFNSENQNSIVMTKTKKQLAYQTIGCYNLIETMTANSKSLLNNNEIEKEIEKYLLITNSYLDLSSVEMELFEKKDSVYKYEYHFTINDEKVILYFNEIAEKDYKDIDEVSSKINGILYMNEKEYKVLGEKEVEKDEVATSLKVYINDNFYLEVEQEIEKNENEYEFKYFENNQKIRDFSIEIEKLSAVTYVEIEEFDLNGNINNSFEFKLNNNLIYCEYEINKNKGQVMLKKNNGKYEYIYE